MTVDPIRQRQLEQFIAEHRAQEPRVVRAVREHAQQRVLPSADLAILLGRHDNREAPFLQLVSSTGEERRRELVDEAVRTWEPRPCPPTYIPSDGDFDAADYPTFIPESHATNDRQPPPNERRPRRGTDPLLR